MEATPMKVIGIMSTTALFLLLGATLPTFAQEEHHEEAAKPAKQEEAKPAKQEAAKPAKQEEAKPAKQEEAKPAKQEAAKPAKQEAAKPAKQEEQAKPPKQTQQAKTEKQQPENKPAKQQEQAKPAKQQEQAKTEEQQGHTNNGAQQHAQRSAAEEQKQRSAPALRLSVRGSGRIPDDRFRASFGHEHVFVINEPLIEGGFSRFQYSGFWFGFVDPWPVGWYYTDNVYVDFIDGGYYLYNPYYPDARVSISVVI
jgi:primosomal protein N'